MSGACMSWELAESGNEFITSVINGADLVPTFSAASVDDLRAEVQVLHCCFKYLLFTALVSTELKQLICKLLLLFCFRCWYCGFLHGLCISCFFAEIFLLFKSRELL